jgi:transcription elongation factor GreA
MTNPASPASPLITGPDLLRAAGLAVDGPTFWGRPVSANVPGVFVVELPAPQPKVAIEPTAVRDWLGRAPDLRLDGKRPTVAELQSRLASFWLPDQALLYIGSSGKSIAARLAGMYKTQLGERRPQSAGYWLRALHDLPKARLWWAATPDAELYEDALLDRFIKAAGALPFAVLVTPSGEHRQHGITHPLHDESGAPAARQPVRKPARKAAPQLAPSAIEAPGRRGSKSAAKGSGNAVAPTHLTPEGLVALETELAELTTERRPEVIARIKAARELGDLSENADYEAARKEQSFLEGRVQQVEKMIKNAAIIAASEPGAAVTLGSTVVVETDRHGEETFTIVGSAEADATAGKISFTSPIGRALVGHRAGETVHVQVPAGAIDFRIVEVQ